MKDPLLQEYTIEELQVEYLMHLIEQDPQAAWPKHNGEIQFRTGDRVVDKWEEQLVQNKDAEINWDEGVDPGLLTLIKRHSKRVAARYGVKSPDEAKTAPEELPKFDLSDLSGFDDSY